MMQIGGLYTVGGLMMLLFLSACAAVGGRGGEGPTPSVRDRLALETVPVSDEVRPRPDDDIPLAG